MKFALRAYAVIAPAAHAAVVGFAAFYGTWSDVAFYLCIAGINTALCVVIWDASRDA